MSRSVSCTAAHNYLAITSAVPAVRASGRPAAGHPVPDFVAADQASDLVGRPGSAGRLGLDYSCDYLRSVIEPCRQCPWPMMRGACAYIWPIARTKVGAVQPGNSNLLRLLEASRRLKTQIDFNGLTKFVGWPMPG